MVFNGKEGGQMIVIIYDMERQSNKEWMKMEKN